MDLKPSIEGVSLVFLGDFNPSIVQPSWLAQCGLIPSEEAEQAKVEIISPQASIFSLPSQVSVTVLRERFQLEADVAQDLQLRDLGVGIFGLLAHTPIRSLGMNRYSHFQIESEAQWHKVGDRLAPKELWNDLMRAPGMRAVIMEERRSPTEGRLQVRVEPSLRVQPGVFLSTNDQRDGTTADLIQALKSSWEEAQRNARELSLKLLSRCLGEK